MLASGLPELVADDEDLARFLTSSSQFNAQGAKPLAFLPSANHRETSVFRHGSEPRDALWAIGDEHVAKTRTLHGAAIVKAGDVRAAQLEVVRKRAAAATRRDERLARRPGVAEGTAEGTGAEQGHPVAAIAASLESPSPARPDNGSADPTRP